MYVCAFTSMHVFIIVSHGEYHVCMYVCTASTDYGNMKSGLC